MHSFYSNENSTGGHYDVCIDNQFSTFHKKLVTIYISVVKYDDWHKYVKELDELHVNVQNFTVSETDQPHVFSGHREMTSSARLSFF